MIWMKSRVWPPLARRTVVDQLARGPGGSGRGRCAAAARSACRGCRSPRRRARPAGRAAKRPYQSSTSGGDEAVLGRAPRHHRRHPGALVERGPGRPGSGENQSERAASSRVGQSPARRLVLDALRRLPHRGGSIARHAQQLAGDDQLLDLGRALVDAQRADRAVEALDGVVGEHAAPPRICTASSTIRCAASVAKTLAIAASQGDALGAAVALARRRGRRAGAPRRARSPCGELRLHELELGERLAELPPRAGRARRASASARAAMPQAAAATVGRRRSSVRMPSLKPSPSSPSRCVGRHAAARRRRSRRAGAARRAPARRRSGARARRPRPGSRRCRALPRRAVGGGEDAVEVGDAGVRDEGLVRRRARSRRRRAARWWRARRRRSRPPARSSRRRPWRGRRRPRAASGARSAVAAGEGDRQRAQALQREDRVGERRGGGERLADQAAGAQVGRRGGRRPRPGPRSASQPPSPRRREQLARLRARRGVVGRRRQRRDLARGEGVDLRRRARGGGRRGRRGSQRGRARVVATSARARAHSELRLALGAERLVGLAEVGVRMQAAWISPRPRAPSRRPSPPRAAACCLVTARPKAGPRARRSAQRRAPRRARWSSGTTRL